MQRSIQQVCQTQKQNVLKGVKFLL